MADNDKLNKMLDEFMLKTELDEITEQKVFDYFGNSELVNNYGNIFHALVHHKYDPKKVFKMLEIFTNAEDRKEDINYRAINTGYHFIQLALYGYTVGHKDFSYTTDFILDLIRFAKKYNLNVNTIDNDGDTIIHTAIASEVYTGKIVPLLYELGPNFDIEIKDSNGNDIYQALLCYKEEAKAGGKTTKGWLERLISEEEEIKILVAMGGMTLEKIDEELAKITEELNCLLNSLEGNLFNNYKEIVEKIVILNCYLEKRKLFSPEHTMYHDIEAKSNQKVVVFINQYLKSLIASPEMIKFKELEKFLQDYSFVEELKLLKDAESNYLEYINQLKLKIECSSCIDDLVKIEDSIKKLSDEELKKELLNLSAFRINHFNNIIEEIKSVTKKIEFIDRYCTDTKVITCEKTIAPVVDFSVLDEETLEQYHLRELNKLENYKNKFLIKFVELVQMFNSFVDCGIMDIYDIEDVILENDISVNKQLLLELVNDV